MFRHLRTSLITLGLLLGIASVGIAMETDLQGKLTPMTPFDRKVISAGLLRDLPLGHSFENQDMDDLFLRATRIRYIKDELTDHWQTVDETESSFTGDCEDKAVWLYTRLKEAGYSSVRVVIGKYREQDSNFHVWVEYFGSGGAHLILDPSMQTRKWSRLETSSEFYTPYFSYDSQGRYRHRK